MNFRRPISVAAAAVGISMVAISASATAITTDDPNLAQYDGGVQLNITTEEKNYATEGVGLFTQGGLDQTSVYGFRVKLTPNENLAINGSGGCIALNSNSTGWKPFDWANADAGKAYAYDDNYVITYTQGTPLFKKTDKYCQVHFQQWWGDSANVETIELLDKNGNVIDYAAAIAEKKAADEAAEAEAAEETAPEDTTAAPVIEDVTVETSVSAEAEEEELDDDYALEDEEDDYYEEEDSYEDEEAEEDTADDSFGGFDVGTLDEGTLISEGGTSTGWGQAVTLRTYNHIDEGEEPGDDIFDESVISPDNYIVVYYDSEVAPELILQSWSGGQGWAKVPCDESLSQPGMAVFTYDYMIAMYQSDDLSTLDAMCIGDQGVDLTVTGVYVVPVASAASDAGDDGDYTVTADTSSTPTNTGAADTSVSSPATGNIALGSILSVMAVAGAAAVAAKKRK